ncbi:CDP-diacylglycerol--serine O-phosphatidyltransferase [Sciscionella marina]|uniref:CDP-diacylglycerol--serine O-phosphatidyltransferase n=1 Tax=Sciscionella marina TaxID=508770 RepID=UPI000382736C|nr:CDP-diacylglycerol--serine O-phosphatidyltransferase [Sciscionella marina]
MVRESVRQTPGIRLLPNAVTVLAVCSGLSAVMFALRADWALAILCIAVAAVLDGLDGRIARLLDATSKIGEQLDSLCDSISFGVAPALIVFIWRFQDFRPGWIVCLLFAVCMVLRLARFNTLLEDEEQPPFAKEFFVGVPAPAGGLLLLVPLMLHVQFGPGFWDSIVVALVWTVCVSALSISRIPTLSVKSVQVSPKLVAPLLVGVGLLAALIVVVPLGALVAVLLVYLAHVPYAVHRYRWLTNHPEAWAVPPRDRRAIRRRSPRRLAIRRPLRRQVAGAARRAVYRHGSTGTPPVREPGERRRRDWRRISLRRR